MNTTVNWNRNISDYFSEIKCIYDIPTNLMFNMLWHNIYNNK